jgi:hypothetical protein
MTLELTRQRPFRVRQSWIQNGRCSVCMAPRKEMNE